MVGAVQMGGWRRACAGMRVECAGNAGGMRNALVCYLVNERFVVADARHLWRVAGAHSVLGPVLTGSRRCVCAAMWEECPECGWNVGGMSAAMH